MHDSCINYPNLFKLCRENFKKVKSKTREKTQTAFLKCSANRSSVDVSKIHREAPVPESHLNIVAGLQPAALLTMRPRHRCFPVITLHTFKFSGAWKFLIAF